MPGTRLRGTTSSRGRVVAIIQARMGSTRFPGKTLVDLAGRPMLEYVVRRVLRAKSVDEVIVATTERSSDDSIATVCARLGVRAYRGPEADVLKRFLGAAETMKAGVIVRVTADCPLIDPEVIDRVVRTRARTHADYASNGLERSWPRGFDVEVFLADALRVADTLAKEPYEREHVTPAIYEHPDRFRLVNVLAPLAARAPNYRVCVDTVEDLQVVRKLVMSADDPDRLTSERIVAFLRSHPDVRAINAAIRQKSLGD